MPRLKKKSPQQSRVCDKNRKREKQQQSSADITQSISGILLKQPIHPSESSIIIEQSVTRKSADKDVTGGTSGEKSYYASEKKVSSHTYIYKSPNVHSLENIFFS